MHGKLLANDKAKYLGEINALDQTVIENMFEKHVVNQFSVCCKKVTGRYISDIAASSGTTDTGAPS